MTDSAQVEANGFTFDVHTAGDESGEPIFLLHGWPQTARSWRQVSQVLTDDRFRTIAPNQRGYSPGARPVGVDAYSIDLLTSDVLAMAEALGYETFHLAGHDWGASIAWYLAAHNPERVRSLVTVSVPHLAAFGKALASDADQQSRSGYIQLLRMEGKAEDVLLENDAERLRQIYLGDVAAEDVDAYAKFFSEPGAMTAVLNWYRAMDSALGELPKVTVPTTYVWGNADQALGRVGAEDTEHYVEADYRFVELDGGHWLPDTHADVIATEILRRTNG